MVKSNICFAPFHFVAKRMEAYLYKIVHALAWSRLDFLNVGSVLKCRGAASDPIRMRAAPGQAYLPGFASV